MKRLDYRKIGAKGFKALGTLVAYVHDCGLDHSLLELVKLRASQINGCANCIDLHANRARELGETEERLQSLVAWWESPCFSEREKAALAWTEAVTLVAESRVPDDVYGRVQAQFSEQEVVDLTFAVVTINSHNRLAVAFRRVPGS
jgi:AhpD family alkylhydroperoxidase